MVAKPTERDATRKARKLAREGVLTRTEEQQAARKRTQKRTKAVTSKTERSTTVPLMFGELQVGKATVNTNGSIIARIDASSLGEALYPAVKNGLIGALQIGPSFWP